MTQAWTRSFRKNANPEHKFQVTVRRFLDMALPLDSFWTAMPTSRASLHQGVKIKAAGYVAGTPDVVVCWQGRAYWIELKADKGSLSEVQLFTHPRILKSGCKVAVCRDLNDVQFWLEQWAIPLRAVVDPRQLSGARSIA